MASNTFKNLIKNEAYRIVLGQFAVIAGLAFFIALLRDANSGISVFLGGAAYGIPNLVFVWRVFSHASISKIQQFMAAFFFGEALKLVLSAVLFVVIVKNLAVSVVWTMMGYIGAIVAFWIASVIYLSKQTKG
jgi:ATP synthase protein I